MSTHSEPGPYRGRRDRPSAQASAAAAAPSAQPMASVAHRDRLMPAALFLYQSRSAHRAGRRPERAPGAGASPDCMMDGTGTGIRTPVPWLRTTCPDP